MSQSQRTGVIGGTVGATIGSLAWLILAGGSVLITLLVIIGGGLCIVGVSKLYELNPNRKFAIMGIALLWLVVLNFLFGNIIYDNIPGELYGAAAGKTNFSPLQLNIYLGIFSLLGFGFIIKDILKK